MLSSNNLVPNCVVGRRKCSSRTLDSSLQSRDFTQAGAMSAPLRFIVRAILGSVTYNLTVDTTTKRGPKTPTKVCVEVSRHFRVTACSIQSQHAPGSRFLEYKDGRTNEHGFHWQNLLRPPPSPPPDSPPPSWPTARAVVGYRQDVARLREAELREIKSKLALSNARPGETDGHR